MSLALGICSSRNGFLQVVISYVVLALAAVVIPPASAAMGCSEVLKGTVNSLGLTQFLTGWAITIAGIHANLDLDNPYNFLALILAH